MGRHSAPDESGGDLLVVAPEAGPERPSRRPRHAASESELVHTDVIDPEVVERAVDAPPREVVDAVVIDDETYSGRAALKERQPTVPIAEIAPPRPQPAPAADADAAPPPSSRPAPAKPKRERSGVADLRLLRSSSALRARCTAAVLLPFILYTIVLVVISRVDVYLFWIWVPAILAGVLFGAQLDSAAKSARSSELPPTPRVTE